MSEKYQVIFRSWFCIFIVSLRNFDTLEQFLKYLGFVRKSPVCLWQWLQGDNPSDDLCATCSYDFLHPRLEE